MAVWKNANPAPLKWMPAKGCPMTSPSVAPRVPSPRSLLARFWQSALAKPLVTVAVVLSVGAATAAISLVYSNASTVTTSAIPAPVQFVAGDDAGPSTLTRYVSAYSLSTNRTYLTATVNGVPESTLTVDSFFKLTNVDTAARTVTLGTAQVTNAYVTGYAVQLYDPEGNLDATVNMLGATPSATLPMAAGETYTAKLTLTLAPGAGAHNVALTNALTLSVA